MDIQQVKISIRNPTVQYGYVDTSYTVAMDMELGDDIETALRCVHRKHVEAMIKVNEDEESRKKEKSMKSWDKCDDPIPFD